MNRDNLKFADLHTHTKHSDGTFTPSELVDYAAKQGIAVLSVTDHDSVSGIDEAIEAGFKAGVEIIPGIELNTDFKDAELHILGYFIDYKNPDFIKKLNWFRESRIERMRMMIAKLNGSGHDITFDEVRDEALNESGGENVLGSIGRPHLARVMVKRKIVEEERAAFERYIGNGKSCYVEVLNKLLPADAVRFIIEFGGLAVMAHPGLTGRDSVIGELVEEGLCGLEVYHSSHDAQAVKKYEKIAADYGLITTGGSDCHGPKPNMQPYCGTVRLPLAIIGLLKKSLIKNKKIA
jgi:hypothetical protein